MNTNLENKQNKIDKKVEKLFKSGKKKFFTPFDLLIYALLLVFVVIATLFVFFLPKPSGSSFEVYYSNQKIATYSLAENAEYIFYIDASTKTGKIQKFDGGQYKDFNKIVVKNGKIAITDTDCRDKSCQVRGAIDYGQLICLPHLLHINVINVQSGVDGST